MNQYEVVKEKVDILQVFMDTGGVVASNNYGDEIMVNCPFQDHDDKKASMSINKEKKVYYCFGCSRKGDVFDLYSELHDVSIKQSLHDLAVKYSINIEGRVKSKAMSYNETTVKIYNEVANHGLKLLLNNSKGYDYVISRGIGLETLKAFKIGYIGNAVALFDFLLNKGYDHKNIIDSGLFDKSKRFTLSDRILFPIQNLRGDVVAFTARAIDEDSSSKYKNSVNKIIKKSEIVYNLHSYHANNKYMFIVEGPMDAIALYEKQKKNAVAVLGKDLSDVQCNMIAQRTSNVVIWLDNDNENVIRSVYKSYVDLYTRGVNVKFVLLDDEKRKNDPCEFCSDTSISSLKRHIISFAEYFKKTIGFIINEKELFFQEELQKIFSEYAPYMRKNELMDIKNYIESKYECSLKINGKDEIDEISLATIGFKKDKISKKVFIKKNNGMFMYLVEKEKTFRLLNFITKNEYNSYDELVKDIIINDNQVIINRNTISELKSYIELLEEA